MDLIRQAIDRPIAVIAAVLMVVMFGLLALQLIPIQLTPDVQRPILTVQTNWRGAAPAEVEREITNRQEEALKGLEGMVRMLSRSEDGRARITLEFGVDQNMDKAILLVATRLDRVTGYPAEADKPTLRTSSSNDNAIGWYIVTRLDGNTKPIHTHGDIAEDVIRERLERIKGVSRVNIYGGSEREMRIIIDPEKMARYGLTVGEVLGRLRTANASISGGDVEEGKRRYVVRTEGEFKSVDQVRAVVLRTDQDQVSGRGGRGILGDIAEV